MTEVPEWLRALDGVTSLNLGANRLSVVPDWLGDLASLTTLSLFGNQLAELPATIGNLTGLLNLELSVNRLWELPDSIGKLTALRSLDVSSNQLVALPDSLADLTRLTTLNLRGNALERLPRSLASLVMLEDLDLYGNSLGAVPAALAEMTALARLNMHNARLTSVPGWLGNLTALTELILDGNHLAALPAELARLTALTVLDLQENELTQTPEWFQGLTNLETLNLHGNQLGRLPDWLGDLRSLTSLHAGRNGLTRIPASLGKLTVLATLDLHGNKLTAIPDSLGQLSALTRLDLADNELTAVPAALAGLTSLTWLNLSFNKLTSLPRQLSALLGGGLQIELSENPLRDPLPELAARGTDALASYLSSIEDAVAQYEAKLLLVGDGNVGKTSLVASLRAEPFVEGRPTTHGIEISAVSFRHPGLEVAARFARMPPTAADLDRFAELFGYQDMTLRAWDFGGQEVYRVTHQFFFTRRALYLVVWNARQGQDQDDVEAWLHRIRLRTGTDVHIILVATHCEDIQAELDYPQLVQAFEGMLGGSFEVDNRTGLGIAQLQQAIAAEAARLPQMGQLLSPRWIAARDEVMALAESEPQMWFDRFEEICLRHGITGAEVVTLAELQHDLGHIIYYGDDDGLRDMVVLNPQWLAKAIGAVLEDQPTRRDGGVLDHSRLRDIWRDGLDGTAYPARFHPYFLRLMEKFDICYRLDGGASASLVAQLVPHGRPDLPWQRRTPPPDGIRSLALVCRMSEPAPGLVPWLTVRHHRASTGLHWRRGVFLRHPIVGYSSEALVELTGPAELALEVRAPSPDLFFNVLRDSIEDLIGRRWPGLGYELLIPCPHRTTAGTTCSGLFPLDGLLRIRERTEATTVPCMECAQSHEIAALLTGFTRSGQPLAADLERIHGQLSRIESSVIRAEARDAEIAEYVRRVLRVVSAEVTDCPRLFTLVPEQAEGLGRLRADRRQFRLTMWCEHPGHWHPWAPASYLMTTRSEWLARIAPYARLVLRTLQLVVPVAGAAADVLMPAAEAAQAQSYLQVMSAVLADLPSQPGQDASMAELGVQGLGGAAGRLTAAEGQALRNLRAILFREDQLRTFGGLQRGQAPSGDFLWVCADHYSDYDPGLPRLP